MSNRALTPVQFYERFAAEREEVVKELLPATLRLERFMAATRVYLQRNPELLNCDQLSLVDALMKCANDGLRPDGRDAAVVPFRDKQSRRLLAQYMPMVQGLLKRARELGEVIAIECEAVYDADHFEVVKGDQETLVHKPCLDAPRGKVRAAYAIFRDRKGVVLHREVILRDQIEKIRKVSRQANGPAWTQWYEEMARKSVIRRGIKYVPMGDELRKIVERDDEFTLLEGSAVEVGASRSMLGALDLDAYDEDGNPINSAIANGVDVQNEDVEIGASADEDGDEDHGNESLVADAEVLEIEAAAEPAPDPAVSPFTDDDDPVNAFADDLAKAKSKAEVDKIVARHKSKITTKHQKQRANLAWKATMQRLKLPIAGSGETAASASNARSGS
jgi:recombination protein RecT